MHPSSRYEPGERVAGKYRLRRLLATGGMAEVWVARNEATGAEVALKVLLGDGEPGMKERFRQEARLSAMLAHRSIVRVFDLVEEADGTLVLVLELLRGETLGSYLAREGPRPALEAIAILGPVLGALAHAHGLGLVHRDVSPTNVFLAVDPDGHVAPKLVDFGIAKPRDATDAVETVDGDLLGTPRYVAPERIRGATDVDGRADVFSAGVVLYEALTGVSPFAAPSASASLAAVLERTVDPDPAIDPRVWLEIRRAIAKQPYERHATADELASCLRAALGETDEVIEAALQRVEPEVARENAPAVLESHDLLAGSVESAASPLRSRVRAGVVLAAAALAVALAIAALAHERNARSEAIVPPPVATEMLATSSAGSLPPTPALSNEPLLPSSVPAPASRPRPGAPRPRPVATTPGF